MNKNLFDAGNLLSNKIQWFLDNNKISEKQVRDYNHIIELIERGSEENERYIKSLQDTQISLTLKHFYLEEKIYILEAICLQHGILDINNLMNSSAVVSDTKEALKTKSFKLPYVFTKPENLKAVSELIDYHLKRNEL